MIGLRRDANNTIRNWIVANIPTIHRLIPCEVVGVVSNDRLIAGVAYHDYQPEYANIQMTIFSISSMWARKNIINQLLKYPFIQLRCFKIVISIEDGNIKAAKSMLHVGFTQEAYLKHHYGKDKHAIIMKMVRPKYDQLYGEENG